MWQIERGEQRARDRRLGDHRNDAAPPAAWALQDIVG
jgi:hypothetical protein